MEYRTERSEGGYAAKALAGANTARTLTRPKGNGVATQRPPSARSVTGAVEDDRGRRPATQSEGKMLPMRDGSKWIGCAADAAPDRGHGRPWRADPSQTSLH